LQEGHEFYACADLLKCRALPLVQGFQGVVSGLAVNIGAQSPNLGGQTSFRKNDNGIRTGEATKGVGAFHLGLDGPRRTFQLSHAGICIQGDKESVPQGPRFFQEVEMPRVQKIENAVCEDDLASASAEFFTVGNRLGQGA